LGISGKTQLSIHPNSDQISQTVMPIGAITINPVKKLDRSEANKPRRGGGGGGGSCMALVGSGTLAGLRWAAFTAICRLRADFTQASRT
jgi:hypothetical protein